MPENYPSLKEFIIDFPLYQIVEYSDENLEEGRRLYYFNETIDSYCPDCNNDSIFSRKTYQGFSISHQSDSWVDKGWFSITLKCGRDNTHELFFVFNAEGKTIQKIGQLPSMASLNLHSAKKYRKVIESKYYKEFTKAIGLAAHGVGVGSFVYLRRIFEFLIEEAHAKVKSTEEWNEDSYIKARIADKIQLLEAVLPDFLVRNKSMYSILSKGIHELEEEQCLQIFPVVKVGIEMILDEKLEKLRREKKVMEATQAISSVNSKI